MTRAIGALCLMSGARFAIWYVKELVPNPLAARPCARTPRHAQTIEDGLLDQCLFCCTDHVPYTVLKKLVETTNRSKIVGAWRLADYSTVDPCPGRRCRPQLNWVSADRIHSFSACARCTCLPELKSALSLYRHGTPLAKPHWTGNEAIDQRPGTGRNLGKGRDFSPKGINRLYSRQPGASFGLPRPA